MLMIWHDYGVNITQDSFGRQIVGAKQAAPGGAPPAKSSTVTGVTLLGASTIIGATTGNGSVGGGMGASISINLQMCRHADKCRMSAPNHPQYRDHTSRWLHPCPVGMTCPNINAPNHAPFWTHS
jgi:hypothetical protein